MADLSNQSEKYLCKNRKTFPVTVSIVRLIAPAQHIREAYLELVGEIDRQMAQLVRDRFQDVLQCKAGCHDCCMRFSVLPLEAAILSEALNNSKLPATRDNEDGKCRLLVDSLCLVYVERPIICRTQGLPLGYVDETAGSIAVSACQLNFSDDHLFTYDELLLMDGFNRRLAELNFEYCHSAGVDPTQRIAIAKLLPVE